MKNEKHQYRPKKLIGRALVNDIQLEHNVNTLTAGLRYIHTSISA